MNTRRRRTAALQCLAWIALMLAAMLLAEPARAEGLVGRATAVDDLLRL